MGGPDELHRPGVGALGVALCELVRPEGTIASSVTVDWAAVDVAAAFAHLAPAVVESDVRAAALAEARFGAGRGQASMLYVNVGSGISHALITGAPPVEAWSSGLALARAAGVSTAEEALRDARHAEVVAEAASRLGQTLAVLVNALDPALVVLAGGLGSVASYREMVAEAARSLIYAPETRALDLVPAATGPDGGLIGAALAAARD